MQLACLTTSNPFKLVFGLSSLSCKSTVTSHRQLRFCREIGNFLSLQCHSQMHQMQIAVSTLNWPLRYFQYVLPLFRWSLIFAKLLFGRKVCRSCTYSSSRSFLFLLAAFVSFFVSFYFKAATSASAAPASTRTFSLCLKLTNWTSKKQIASKKKKKRMTIECKIYYKQIRLAYP